MTDKATDKRPQFFLIEDAVVTDFNLDPYTGWLYIVIVKHADRKTGEAFPGIARLAKLCNMSRSQVMRGIKTLEDKHLIEVRRDTKPLKGEKRQREVNHYQVLSATGNAYQQLGVVSDSNYPSASQQLGVVSGVDSNNNQYEPESLKGTPSAKSPTGKKYPVEIQKWSRTHITSYYQENKEGLDALTRANPDDIRDVPHMSKQDALAVIERFQDCIALNIPAECYESAIKFTKGRALYEKKNWSWHSMGWYIGQYKIIPVNAQNGSDRQDSRALNAALFREGAG